MNASGYSIPTMSLVAQFDDFCRRTLGNDDEERSHAFLEFVRNQEVCRQRWEAAERCATRLAEENRSLVLTNSQLQEELQCARAALEEEVEKGLRCEAWAGALQLQLDQVRHCIFSGSFQNREKHMIRVLKNIFDHRGGGPANTTADESTSADKLAQSMQPSPKSGLNLSGSSRGAASRETSREEDGARKRQNWRAKLVPGTLASGRGTRQPFCVGPIPTERSSVGSSSAGPRYTEVGLARPDPIGDASSAIGFAGHAPAGAVSDELGFAGLAARAVCNGPGFSGSVPAGTGAVSFCFARPIPTGDASVGLGLAGPCPAEAFSNGLGFAGPLSGGAAFARPVPVGRGLAGTVLAPCAGECAPIGPGFPGLGPGEAFTLGPAPAGLNFVGPWPAKHASAEQSSAWPGSAPAKVHFELSGSQKSGNTSSHATTSRATSGRIGEVFATTVTMVAGEPGYVATVASQMEGNSSTLSSQQTQQSVSKPAFSARRSKKASPKRLDESQVEQESGFFSGLVEHPGPQRSTSTPVDESPLPPQQTHAFTRRQTVGPEVCTVCSRRIRFYRTSLCCNTCHLVCHVDCKKAVPLLCTPKAPPEQAEACEVSTVGESGKHGTTPLDYTQSVPPLMPLLVDHCIREVERRCTMEKGPLYGSAVAAEEVDSLLGQLLSGCSLPALDGYSLPVICGVLVAFLASFRETIITNSIWHLLAKATEEPIAENRLQKILDATVQLPAPNHGTLSVLLAHLHYISATSLGGDGRSLDELTTVFAPLVVGCSENDISTQQREQDRPVQELIMHCLLSVPQVYWMDSAAALGRRIAELQKKEPNLQHWTGDEHY